MESPTDTSIYRSKLNPRINRNFEVFTPTDFLAAITQHIPEKGAHLSLMGQSKLWVYAYRSRARMTLTTRSVKLAA